MKWDDLKVGQVIDFRHRNRSQRLAGRPPEVRRGRIERIWYPAERQTERRLPQVRVRVLKKDGTPRAGVAGHHVLYEDDAIDDVVRIVQDPADVPLRPIDAAVERYASNMRAAGMDVAVTEDAPGQVRVSGWVSDSEADHG